MVDTNKTPPAPEGHPTPFPAKAVAWLLGLIVGALLYLVAAKLPLPRPFYLPVVGQWTFSPDSGVIKMGYYGIVLWGLVGFGLGWGLGHLPPLRRAFQREAAARWLAMASVVVVGLFLTVFAVTELLRWTR